MGTVELVDDVDDCSAVSQSQFLQIAVGPSRRVALRPLAAVIHEAVQTSALLKPGNLLPYMRHLLVTICGRRDHFIGYG